MRSFKTHQCISPKIPKSKLPSLGQSRRRLSQLRRGAVAVLGLVLTISLVTLMAFTIDFGYINVAQTQMRRCADASAMAACWDVFDQQVATHSTLISHTDTLASANESALLNLVGSDQLQIDATDLELGNYGLDGSWSVPVNPADFNAVRIHLRRHTNANGELPLFFGQLTGRNSQKMQIQATAAMYAAIGGFYVPDDSSELIDIMPITFEDDSWDEAVAGFTDDDYTCSNGGISNGSDGVCEIWLYPSATGSSGNCGTVDIGGSNNSTSDISRQIVHGISQQDMIDLGKPLAFDSNGELELNGDTGISAGIKDELKSIIGETRIIPIYTRVTGNGNNSTYTIIRWEGVTIIDVKLTGAKKHKRVLVQPTKVVARHAKIDYTGTNISTHVVTPVMLVE